MSEATIWVLLKGDGKRGWGLYENGVLVANYSFQDYRDYIDDQIAMRAGEECELIEREHVGAFPEELPNKGLKQERLKSRGYKNQKEIDAEKEEKPKGPTPREIVEAEMKNSALSGS